MARNALARPARPAHEVRDAGGVHTFVDTPAGLSELMGFLIDDDRIGSTLVPRRRADGLMEWAVNVRPVTPAALAARLRTAQEPQNVLAVPEVWVPRRSGALGRVRAAIWFTLVGLFALICSAAIVAGALFAWSVIDILIGTATAVAVFVALHWLLDRCRCCPVCGRRRR
jgi:hypothetical protein